MEEGFYYISCDEDPEIKWQLFLEVAFAKSNMIEIDICKSWSNKFETGITEMIKHHPWYPSFQECRISNEQFFMIYPWFTMYFKFLVNDEIKKQLLDAKDLMGFAFKDVLNFAFYKDNECMAYSITSENMVCIKLNEAQLSYFDSKGITYTNKI